MRNINKRNTLLASVGAAALVVGMGANAQAGTSVTSVDRNFVTGVYTNPVVTATAGLSSVNNQIADIADEGVAAIAGEGEDDLEVYLDLFSEADTDVSGAFDLDENTVSATAVGNDGSLTTDIDTLPAFNDDVAMSNLQRIDGGNFDGEDFFFAMVEGFVTGEDSDVLARSTGATIEATAYGLGEDSIGGIDGEDSILTLDGATLSVNDNAVNTSATGSAFEGTTIIADGVTVNGDGEDASITHFLTDYSAVDADDEYTLTADADIALGSLQVGEETGVSAVAFGTTVQADLENVLDSSVDVSGNDVTATATLLDASQTIATGEGAADVDATMALSNGQTVDDSGASAGLNQTFVGINVADDLDSSSATVVGNTIKASSNLANAEQSIAVDANAIGSATLAEVDFDYFALDGEDIVDGQDTITGLEVLGDTIIANSQQTYEGLSVSAVNQAGIGLDLGNGDRFSSATLSVADNAIEAVATGVTASNAIDLDGNTVAGGVGVASKQESALIVAGAIVDEAMVGAFIDEDLEASSLDVSGNMIRSISVVQSNANSVAVSATDFVFQETFDGEDAHENVEDPSAAIVAANVQNLVMGEDFAIVSDSGVFIDIEDDVDQSSVALDANAIVAAAYGNDADAGYGSTGAPNGSVIDLDATNIVGGTEGADIAVATSAQDIESAMIAAAISTGDREIVDAYVDYDLDDSSLSTSGNAIQAQAIGNQATTLTAAVDAVVIDTGVQYAYNEVHDDHDVEAAFVAISEQNVDDSWLLASLRGMDGDDEDSALVLTTVGVDVTDSTVESKNNLLSAAVIGNNQATGVELAATDIRTTVGVRNDSDVNYSDFDVRIGLAGAEGSEGTPATTSNNQSDVVNVGEIGLSGIVQQGVDGSGNDTYTNTDGSDYVFQMSDLTAAEITFYQNAGFVVDADADTLTWESGSTFVATGITVDAFDDADFDGQDTFQIKSATIAGATPPTDATHNDGGVIVEVWEDILGSTIEVASNTVSGSAKANVASNAVDVSGVTLAQGQTYGLAYANDSADDNYTVEADYSLTNEQETEEVDLDVDVYASFGLDTEFDDIDDSSIAIDNNTLKATAAVNVVTNDLSIAATNVNGDEDTPVTSVLFSEQEINEDSSGSSIATLADAEIFAPIASDNSTISLSGNKTQALSIANEGVNTLTVDVVNATNPDEDYAEIEDSSDFIKSDTILEAHHLLVAKQEVLELDDDVSIEAVADATIYNLDELQGDTQGLINGSVTLSENLVSATALANNNTNTMTFEADAVLGLTGAVLNGQTNEADVDATTTASIRVGLNGYEPAIDQPGYAADASSVALNDNRVAATARGNIATNALNASGTVLSFDADADVAYAKGESGYTAEGDLLLASHQVNSGDITAIAEDTFIGAALNSSLGEFNALNASSVSVDGNVVMASATANTAYNTVTVTGYDGESANNVALVNEQYTSAMVKAVVRNAQVGSVSNGAVVGSTVGVVGNTLSATATGNVASSVIKRR